MNRDGKYIYCIIASEHDFNFGPVGIGGRGDSVVTIGTDDLRMVVSDHPLTRFVVNPENILSHQKVLEEVMKEFNAVLPLKFGTVAATPDEIRDLLFRRQHEFMELLRVYENKVEINLKCRWKHMEEIFLEIKNENTEVLNITKEIEFLESDEEKKMILAKAGEKVKTALAEKKENEAEKIISMFRNVVFDYKLKPTRSDELFLDTALLINSGREKEIDFLIEDISDLYGGRVNLTYTSALPVYSFIDIKIFPEEWQT